MRGNRGANRHNLSLRKALAELSLQWCDRSPAGWVNMRISAFSFGFSRYGLISSHGIYGSSVTNWIENRDQGRDASPVGFAKTLRRLLPDLLTHADEGFHVFTRAQLAKLGIERFCESISFRTQVQRTRECFWSIGNIESICQRKRPEELSRSPNIENFGCKLRATAAGSSCTPPMTPAVAVEFRPRQLRQPRPLRRTAEPARVTERCQNEQGLSGLDIRIYRPFEGARIRSVLRRTRWRLWGSQTTRLRLAPLHPPTVPSNRPGGLEW